MAGNRWVRKAYYIAPNNLVIRQYCLIDMFALKPYHLT
jgi:hypothetical protein